MGAFVKFGIVGLGNTLITIGSYHVFVYLGLNYILANVISYLLGMMNSYYWNKNWVFRVKPNEKKTFVKFIFVNMISLLINNFTLILLVGIFFLSSTVSQLLATVLGLWINLILNKIWTFEKKEILGI
ncbi:GtrA family protein [Caldifermentibacillus hisashii]|uniref:GtrA family protein n=1 Tax=Caldifermentibacillus hisashii TaxID=996558 RepID=A0ABU9K1N3_9BACI